MSNIQGVRTVLITGGTDGLGRAAALLFAERGYRVFAAGRSPEKRAQLDAIARERKLPLETVELNVCDDESARNAVGYVLSQAGAIDVLVNNAGIGYMGTIEDLQIEDWRRQFETNVFGLLRVTQAALPSMRERKRGRILMMSSVAGLVTVPAQGAYSSSKHALEGLTNALRLEMFPFGIEVRGTSRPACSRPPPSSPAPTPRNSKRVPTRSFTRGSPPAPKPLALNRKPRQRTALG